MGIIGVGIDICREISGFQALTGRSWSAPSLAGGRLLLRDQDEMAAFDLRQPACGAKPEAGR